MTIHKSKGLEFSVVIFAYDLDIYRQINPKVWLNDLPETYQGFPELLLNYNKELSLVNQKGAEIYRKQQEELELDNFNLLYVALTRAVEQLHIVVEKKMTQTGESLNHYSGIFINYLKSLGKWHDEQLDYGFGEIKRISKKEELESKNTFQEDFISESRQSHQINLLPSSSKLWGTTQGESIEYGNLFHEIMAQIKTENDIDPVFEFLKQQGYIDNKKLYEIKQKVIELVNHPELKEYFSDQFAIYNEREVVFESQMIIPDRLVFKQNKIIIIDYKTGEPQKKHEKQLKNYASLLERIGLKVKQKIIIYVNNRTLIIREVD